MKGRACDEELMTVWLLVGLEFVSVVLLLGLAEAHTRSRGPRSRSRR